MSATSQRRSAWALAGLTATLVVAQVVLSGANGLDLARFVDENYLLGLATALTFAITGLVVVVRRPGNVVGWLLLVAPLGEVASGVAFEYARFGLRVRPDMGLPVLGVMTLLGQVLWIPSFAITMLLPLRFPDGTLLSTRWRAVEWSGLAATSVLVGALVAALWPHRGLVLLSSQGPPEGSMAPYVEAAFGVAAIVLVGAGVAGLVSVALRYRRAEADGRRQLRWVLSAMAVALVSAVVSFAVGGAASTLVQSVTIPLIGVAIGVSILRYRLYEIERIISRTATYAIVTAVLLGLYALLAVVPAAAFHLDSDLLVAAATLAVAAAFGPLRRRVQALVDRRFNRASYDATLVVQRFGERLRRDVAYEGLGTDLARVAAETVQPTHVSVWLRPGGGA